MVVYTHDKHGRPLPESVRYVLNNCVIPKRRPDPQVPKQHASVRSAADSFKVLAAPSLGDVPHLESEQPRKRKPSEQRARQPPRLPCKVHPLQSMPEPEPTLDPPGSVIKSGIASRTIRWLVQPFVTEEPAEPPRQHVVVDEVPFTTFAIHQQLIDGGGRRRLRINSPYYRILALENAMVRSQKISGTSVRYVKCPRPEPLTVSHVFGIANRMERRRPRVWGEVFEDLALDKQKQNQDKEQDDSQDEQENQP